MTAQHVGRYGSFDFEGQPIYHTDLDACLPANALAPAPKHHHWRTLDYACDDLSGVMLLAGPETAPPPITYRLAESGWHAISIGVMPMEGHVGAPLGFQVRLSGEETASVLDLHPHDRPARRRPYRLVLESRRRERARHRDRVDDASRSAG